VEGRRDRIEKGRSDGGYRWTALSASQLPLRSTGRAGDAKWCAVAFRMVRRRMTMTILMRLSWVLPNARGYFRQRGVTQGKAGWEG